MAAEGLREPSLVTKEQTAKITTAARLAASNGPATIAAERKIKKKKAKEAEEQQPPPQLEQTSDTGLGTAPDPPTPTLISISVPEGATRDNSPQTTPTRASAPPTANPSPAPTLPFQHASMDGSPSPPPSPSPMGQQPASPFFLGPRPLTPITLPSGMQVDDPAQQALSTPEQVNIILSQNQPGNENNAPPADNLPTPLQALLDEEQEQTPPNGNGNGNNLFWRDPLERFTDAPMPQVYEAHPTSAFEFIDRELIGTWERYPGSKLIAIPFGTEVQEQAKHKYIRTKIFAAAADITRSQAIAVAAPAPNEKAKRARTTPTTFLIYKLDETQRETLLHRRVWSSAAITFRVAPLTPSRPNFLFSISGLSTGACEDVYNMVKAVWQDTQSVAFYQSILGSRSDNERPSTQLALEKFVSTMCVQCINTKIKGGILSPKFNVYTDTKDIYNHLAWSQIRNYLAKRMYKTTMLGQGSVIIAPHKCAICHGVDHPKGMCPFPDVPNWNGPVGQTGAGTGQQN